MTRAIWTGNLSFGLVSIPVRLFQAAATKDVRFHQFQAGTGQRIRLRRVVPEAEAETEPGLDRGWDRPTAAPGPSVRPEPPGEPAEDAVAYEDVVKGYELDRDTYVMVAPEELEGLAPEQTRTIEIEDFVDLADIDPVYFEKSYYVAPQRGGEKPYALLLRAMQDSGKVAIARFVLRTREHLAAVRPMDGVIGLETLFYADEVRPPAEIGLPLPAQRISERELTMARALVESLATAWEPERYRDTYRERVLELIEAKARGEELVIEAPPSPPAVPDLMAALRASVEAARQRRAGDAERSGRSKRAGG
ncbi:MAG TPA: Ku protein [Actinomycetota bacterium]